MSDLIALCTLFLGCTIEAVSYLERNGFRSTLMGAVEAAVTKSKSLAGKD